MSRSFYHYTFWEDCATGLYSGLKRDDIIEKCKHLLGSKKFLSVGKKATLSFPMCTCQMLTTPSCNNRAFIGSLACLYKYGASENETRIAWWEVKEEKRKRANIYADEIINNFIQKGFICQRYTRIKTFMIHAEIE